MNKKRGFLAVLAAWVLIPLVSAVGSGELESSANQIIDWIKSIFSPFFAVLIGTEQVNEYFFAKILLLILIYVIVLTVLKKIDIFKKSTGICVLISAIVSILGIRYLSETNLITFILLPYGTFFMAIATFFPFFIYFFFVHTSVNSPTGRRIAWILFAAVFFGLWFSRLKALGGFNISNLGAGNWIYIIAIGGVAACFFFDREIQKYFALHQISSWKRKQNDASIARLQAGYQEIADVNSEHARRRKREIEDRLRDLGAKPPS